MQQCVASPIDMMTSAATSDKQSKEQRSPSVIVSYIWCKRIEFYNNINL